ncbi:Hpt domain-containing protein [Rubritalea sp.]|uniref:Hpt domain-containing protein n=1 Tax=Rubritalea sp. TaxID=2109375 RepID=UPI003EF0F96B
MCSLLDISHFRDLVGGDAASFSCILDDFQTVGNGLIESITQEAESNQQTAKDALHQLKGSSGMLGMSALYSLCKELEKCNTSGFTLDQKTTLREVFVNSLTKAKEDLSSISGPITP